MATTAVDERKDVAPDDIPKPGWKAVLRRTAKEFSNDNLTDWAAALTYYAVLALFPAMIVLVALVGLFGQYPQTTNALLDILRQVGVDKNALTAIGKSIDDVVKSKGGAGALLGVGLLTALWSASGYIGAFMRASNAIFEKPEGRPFYKLRPLQVLVTLVMMLLFALTLMALVVTGPLAEAIGNKIGLGSTAVPVWNIAILFGQELNAEIERGRELAAGKPAVEDIQLPLRGRPKKDPERQAADISRQAVRQEQSNGGAKHDEAVAQLSRDAPVSSSAQEKPDRPR